MSSLAIETPAAELPERGAPAAPVLSARGVRLRRGTAIADDAVDLDIRPGEILALVGDNGAGKTTLIDILSGWQVPDSGKITVADSEGAPQELVPGSPRAALRAGICALRRGSTLAGSLTALQNIIVGTQSLWRLRLSRPGTRRRIRALLERLSIRFDIDVPVSRLGAGDRKRIELVRALFSGARILLLDEPAADLTRQESEALFRTLRILANEDGIAVVLATHRVVDAFEFADRLAVLHQGRKLADAATSELDRVTVATLTTGRIFTRPPPSFRPTGEALIEFRKVDAEGRDDRSSLSQVSFDLHAGEILGIAGIGGNGQDTLADIVSGLQAPALGTVLLFGRPLRRFDAAAFVRAGIGRIPADRDGRGIVGAMSIADNIVIEDFHRFWFQHHGFIRHRDISEHVTEFIESYALDCPDPRRPASTLRPIELQRLLVARALERGPRLIVAAEPTDGLDAATTRDVHDRLIQARDNGAGILLISQDVDELLMLADMIAVLHHGRLTVPQPSAAFDAASLGHMMGGHGSLAIDWSGWNEGT